MLYSVRFVAVCDTDERVFEETFYVGSVEELREAWNKFEGHVPFNGWFAGDHEMANDDDVPYDLLDELTRCE